LPLRQRQSEEEEEEQEEEEEENEEVGPQSPEPTSARGRERENNEAVATIAKGELQAVNQSSLQNPAISAEEQEQEQEQEEEDQKEDRPLIVTQHDEEVSKECDDEEDEDEAGEEEKEDEAKTATKKRKKKKSKSEKKRQQLQQQEQKQQDETSQKEEAAAKEQEASAASTTGGKRLEDSPADRLAVFTAKLNEAVISAEVRQSGKRSVLVAVRVNPPVLTVPAGAVKDMLTIDMGSVACIEVSDGRDWCFGTMLAPKSLAGTRGSFRKDGLRVVSAEVARLPTGDVKIALLPSSWEEVDRLSLQSGNTQDRLKRKALSSRMKAAEVAWKASNPKSGS